MNHQTFISKRIILSSILFTLISILIYTSCSKDKATIKNVSQPIAALIDTIKLQDQNCTCTTGLLEYKWNNDTVYEKICGPLCECLPVIYNTKAEPDTLNNVEYNDFAEQRILIRTAWTCNN